MHKKLIDFNLKQRKTLNLPKLQAGDVLKIHRKIKEGGKERTQIFQGTVIAMRGGQSSSPMLTVRKVSFGVGVELVFPLYSPQIEKIEFVKRTRARRSKLYFVRHKSVKVLSKKLKEVTVKGNFERAEPIEEVSLGVPDEAPQTTDETTEAPEPAKEVEDEKKA